MMKINQTVELELLDSKHLQGLLKNCMVRGM